MQTSKNNGKKLGMDSEVTRIVLIFLLLLVIIVLLVAAFMSLGNGSSSDSENTIVIQMTEETDENGDVVAVDTQPTTNDPNHNVETETIPDEILNPVTTDETQETTAFTETESTATQITTTGTRPADTTPVYVVSDNSDIATLAPALTTANDENSALNTVTTTVSASSGADDSSAVTVNYTVSLSGSASIYATPGGSATGSVGTSGTFTIVQEMTDSSGVKWGKLKSGAGWVKLS